MITSPTTGRRRPGRLATAGALALSLGLLAGCSESDVVLRTFDPARDDLLEASSGRAVVMVGEGESILTSTGEWNREDDVSLLLSTWTNDQGQYVGTNLVSTPTASFHSSEVTDADDDVACWVRVDAPRPDGDSSLALLSVVTEAEVTSSNGDIAIGTTDLRQALLTLGPLVDGTDLSPADGQRVDAEFLVINSELLVVDLDLITVLAAGQEAGVTLPAELETIAGMQADIPIYGTFSALGQELSVEEPTQDVVEVESSDEVAEALDSCS